MATLVDVPLKISDAFYTLFPWNRMKCVDYLIQCWHVFCILFCGLLIGIALIAVNEWSIQPHALK